MSLGELLQILRKPVDLLTSILKLNRLIVGHRPVIGLLKFFLRLKSELFLPVGKVAESPKLAIPGFVMPALFGFVIFGGVFGELLLDLKSLLKRISVLKCVWSFRRELLMVGRDLR